MVPASPFNVAKGSSKKRSESPSAPMIGQKKSTVKKTSAKKDDSGAPQEPAATASVKVKRHRAGDAKEKMDKME